MIVLLLVSVVLLSAGLVHYHYRHHPDFDLETVLARTFAALRLPLRDGGCIPGDQVWVVQRPRYPRQQFSTLVLRQGAEATDSFWYCAGPEGHFWLAIAHHERPWLLWEVSWVVRPLTAERMRAALQDDPEALQRAFGDVRLDQLMA